MGEPVLGIGPAPGDVGDAEKYKAEQEKMYSEVAE